MVKKAKKPAENVKKSHNLKENSRLVRKTDESVDKIHELEQELQIRIEDNAELYRQLCNAQNQIKEANKVIKYFAKTKIGKRQKDGTYVYMSDSFTNYMNPFGTTYIMYDPRPAKNYLKKWGKK